MQTIQPRLWLSEEPLVLASKSKARRAMLVNAGIPVEVIPSSVNEPFLQKRQGASSSASEVAVMLAKAKATNVGDQYPSRLVLGSDQTLELTGRTLTKVRSRADAKDRLTHLAGGHHYLHSAFCFVRDGKVLYEGVDSARISIRPLSEDFVEAYLDLNGDDVLASVAVYKVEGMGLQMINHIEGDWFTIQGLPLARVIEFLQLERFLLS